MHGWRGRLGLIVPSSNTTNEAEFAGWLPPGVSLHAARLQQERSNAAELAEMAAGVGGAADLLATADVDVIAYGCTTGSLVEGPDHARDIERSVTDRTGVPTVATAASIKRAFDALDLESLVIATPYIDELNELEVEYLEAAGYDVVAIDGRGLELNTDIGRQDPRGTYRQARALPHDEADGLFVSCTNYRSFEVIEALERDLDLPVVTSNQATLWDALGRLGVDRGAVEGLGQLFDA